MPDEVTRLENLLASVALMLGASQEVINKAFSEGISTKEREGIILSYISKLAQKNIDNYPALPFKSFYFTNKGSVSSVPLT